MNEHANEPVPAAWFPKDEIGDVAFRKALQLIESVEAAIKAQYEAK